ncbi:DNAJ protein JJJ1 homolog [Triticum urartu]|uniref:DnaJ homolog subfamily C member 21 n=1 Tax=Triticum urartu TaxID=4572 RepID=A0A8R7UDT5_TRIUA|nr:DNAJ protein JJJ1 homolog [Triticum urartu]
MASAASKCCYYEILGLSRDCSPTDIKLAFRRLALTLHPDKQAPGSDVAAATAAFQELQHAHSVLSDPQERAYYDSHRSQILFADPVSSRSGTASASPVPDLFSFFSTSAFSGFSDSGRGFYKVYGDVFDKVYAQEVAYARRMGIPTDSISTPPVIGNLDSPYTQVTAFYSYWLGFGSVMDFGWAAEWDASRGENRRVRRLMEEDNKKAMRKARREYNDAVRGLAAFCKKRDKRVVDMALRKKAEEEKKKKEEMERKKAEEKKKKERAMAYQEPEWARVDEIELAFEEEDDEETREKAKEELYCVACNKKFKSEKQWKNHEQSRKHKDKVADLRMAFKEEEEALKEAEEEAGGEWEEVDVGFDFKPANESEESDWSDAAEELAEELDEGLEVADEDNGNKDFNNGEQEVGSYDETSVLEAMLSSRKNKKSGYVVPQEEAPSVVTEDDNSEDRNSEVKSVKKKGRRRRASKKGQDEGSYADSGHGMKNDVPYEESVHDNDENDADDKAEGPPTSNDDGTSASVGSQQNEKTDNPKKNKKNKKGAEKKTTVSADLKFTSKGKKQKEVSKARNDCETCGDTFESRSKLFSHLEETGHAVIKARQKKH